MKRILAISGSRADAGLLEWPVKVLRESFDVIFEKLEPYDPSDAFSFAEFKLNERKPDCLLILGDRWEILQAAIAAHLQRIPIAHIGGGDTSEGSYDNQMRDAISMLATYHFATSEIAAMKLHHLLGREHVHMVGNIAIDYIRHGDWKQERSIQVPYVVVSYQRETADMTNELPTLIDTLPPIHKVFVLSNIDTGSTEINAVIKGYCSGRKDASWTAGRSHAEFLNLIYHCELFIGNSSSMFYECPELGVKTQIIGKRQQGRVIPTGDGKSSERIREILCRVL